MQREWAEEDLIASWTLVGEDWGLVGNKTGATRLGFSLLLKFFELEARFPHNASEVPAPAVDYVAEQVKVHPGEFAHHDWNGRAIERLEPPGRIERIIGAATAAFEQRFCDRTVPRLGEHCAERLEDFAERQLLAELKADPGQVGLETLLREIDKLNAIRACGCRRTCSPAHRRNWWRRGAPARPAPTHRIYARRRGPCG